MCIEILLNDGTTKLFLSTKGEADDVSKPLKMFWDYVDGKKPEDALMQEIDNEVDTVKHCDEWRRDYMTLAPRCFLGAFSYGIFKELIYALCRKLV